jgi:hypothetical protein
MNKWLFRIHRWVGAVVGLFFLMWCLSGLVLVYHPFPNVDERDLQARMEPLPDSLPAVDSVAQRLPEGAAAKVRTVTVRRFQGQTLFDFETKDTTYTLCADSAEVRRPVTAETIRNVARRWVDAPIARIDTLHSRDQWIMYSRYLDEIPIAKCYFDDAAGHELYISIRTGEVLQFTDRSSRLWAYVGAIPHKFYLPILRRDNDVWIRSLTTGGVVALIAVLTGIIVGLIMLRRNRKARGKLGSPYKKAWLKAHHVTGLTFGLVLIGFAFSGAMALQRIPEWIIPTHGDYRVSDAKMRGKSLPLSAYTDYRAVRQLHPEVRQIVWNHFRDVPIYDVTTDTASFSLNASTPELHPLQLSPATVEKAIGALHKGESFTISQIDRYEEYYISRWTALPLPAYKVMVDNADRTRYYVDPATGSFRNLNRARMAKKWVFSGLHYFNIRWLVEHPTLWTIAIWTACLGGAFVSLSGVWINLKRLRRKSKKRKA